MTKTIQKHINDIQVGDTVICKDGHERTVGRKDIGRDFLLGATLWGDSYKAGNELVTVVDYRK